MTKTTRLLVGLVTTAAGSAEGAVVNAYNANERVKHQVYPAGEMTSYAYDADGFETDQTDPWARSPCLTRTSHRCTDRPRH